MSLSELAGLMGRLAAAVSVKDTQATTKFVLQLFPERAGAIPEFSELIRKILANERVDFAIPDPSDFDMLFIRHLRDVADSQNVLPNIIEIGEEYDCIQGAVPYSMSALLSKLSNWSVSPSPTNAIVMACRDEGPWLVEWIAYHRALGFNDFYIGFNDNTDGSDQLIKCLANHGVIRAFRNKIKPGSAPQMKFYNYAANFVRELFQHRLIFFIDADEFIVPSNSSILLFQEKLTELGARSDVDCIFLPWVWCSGNHQFAWRPGLLTDRFQFATESTIVKCGVKPAAVWSMHHPHAAQMIVPSRCVNASLEPADINLNTGAVGTGTAPVAHIHHYFGKSFEEFALKQFRGRGDGPANENRDFNSFNWGQKSSNVKKLPFEIEAKLQQEIKLLMSLEGVEIMSKACEINAKQNLHSIRQKIDLIAEFNKIAPDEKLIPA